MIETNRLIIQKYHFNMGEAIYPVINNKKIADNMLMIPYPYPRESIYDWLKYLISSYKKESALEFAVYLKETSEYIGNAGFVSLSNKHESAELGYFIAEKHWGKGYAKEACNAIIEYGFTSLKLNRIFARVMKHNEASKAVLKYLGMRHEGCFLQEFKKNDSFIDIDYYAILKQDYNRIVEE